MEFFFCGSLTTIAKKDKDKKQQKVIPVRRSDWIRNATKSDFYLYKQVCHVNLPAQWAFMYSLFSRSPTDLAGECSMMNKIFSNHRDLCTSYNVLLYDAGCI